MFKILVIEDDFSLQNIITKRLLTEGYQVDNCFYGQTGYEYADGIDYDCIILDLMLPKLNGIINEKPSCQRK
jgi:DNA-binding response OmpR family regulator